MKRNMKKTLVSGLALSMLLPLVPMEPAEAAGWKQDGAGWWWQEDNASYPVNTWNRFMVSGIILTITATCWMRDGIGLTEIVTICMRAEQWRRIHGSAEVM